MRYRPSASVVLTPFSVRDQVHRRLAGRGRVGVPFVPVLGMTWHGIEKLKFGVNALTQLPAIFCLFVYFYFLDIMRERTFKFPPSL